MVLIWCDAHRTPRTWGAMHMGCGAQGVSPDSHSNVCSYLILALFVDFRNSRRMQWYLPTQSNRKISSMASRDRQMLTKLNLCPHLQIHHPVTALDTSLTERYIHFLTWYKLSANDVVSITIKEGAVVFHIIVAFVIVFILLLFT